MSFSCCAINVVFNHSSNELRYTRHITNYETASTINSKYEEITYDGENISLITFKPNFRFFKMDVQNMKLSLQEALDINSSFWKMVLIFQ